MAKYQHAVVSSALLVLCLSRSTWQLRADSCENEKKDGATRPNVVLFFADDVGYGDLAVYGHPTQEWNRVDKLATEGIRFTQWYSGESVCTPSRAALLTARLPVRTGVYGHQRVFLTWMTSGLPKDEVTLGEIFQRAGYSTGMVGKWHLGINEYNATDGSHLPHHHGFDWVGTNMPNSMLVACNEHQLHVPEPDPTRCFLYEGSNIIQQPINMDNLTDRFIMDAKKFIKYNNVIDNTAADNERPFFLYYPMSHTHADLTVMPRFRGASQGGAYGDNVHEMAYAVGEILDVLEQRHLYDDTLVLFVSDNGAQSEICTEGGSSAPFRGEKATTWEGGFRVPAIVSWPAKIPPGQVSSAVVTTMDIMPTLADLIGESMPSDRVIDGKSIVDILLRGSQTSPHELIYFYCNDRLSAVRYRNHKVHFYTCQETTDAEYKEECPGGVPTDPTWCCKCIDCVGSRFTEHSPPIVFNLIVDPKEIWPLPPSEALRSLLADVDALVTQHLATVTTVPPLLTDEWRNDDVIPCCEPPSCECNYP